MTQPLCFACLQHPAHPDAFGLCESCDDLPGNYPLATRPEPEADTLPTEAGPRAEGRQER